MTNRTDAGRDATTADAGEPTIVVESTAVFTLDVPVMEVFIITEIVVDGPGDVYVTGAFGGNADFGTTTASARGRADGYLTSLNEDLVERWTVTWGASNTGGGQSLHALESGGVLLGGGWDGTTDLAGRSLTARGADDCFVSRFFADGSLSWVTQVGTSGDDCFSSRIERDPSSNVLLFTNVVGDIDLGGGRMARVGSRDLILLVVDPDDGSHIDSRRWPANAGSSRGLVVLSDGGLCLGVRHAGLLDFGDGPLPVDGAQNVVVACLAADRSVQWTQTTGGDGPVNVSWLDGDDDAVYATGYATGSYDLGAGTVVSNAMSRDAWAASYEPATGAHRWSRSSGGDGSDSSERADLGTGDSLYTAGSFENTADFGDGVMLTSNGDADGYVIAYDPNGAVLWAWQVGGPGRDAVEAVAIGPAGTLYVAGYITGVVEIGSETHGSPGTVAGFVSRVRID